MGTPFLRAWHSVRRKKPGPTPPCHSESAGKGSECLTADVLLSIFSRLSVQELAAASMVCRNWRDCAAQEHLWQKLLRSVYPDTWEHVFFAETKLRSGPAFRSSALEEQQLSFKEICKRRSSAPVCVILDGGSGYCKYGSSNYDVPHGRLPTFLEFGNIETPLAPRLKDLFVTIFECVQTKPSSQPIIISEPLCNQDNTAEATASRRQLREVTFTVLFSLGVPAVCSVNQAVLALFAARQISGIVLNLGFHSSTVTPILRGKVMRDIGIETIGQGAMRLTGHLGEVMQQRGMRFKSMYTVREVKETLCYVAQDYEQEALRCSAGTCTVADEGEFTLREERYRSPEILFQPRTGGLYVTQTLSSGTFGFALHIAFAKSMRDRNKDVTELTGRMANSETVGQAMSLHQAVALCMYHCADYVVGEPSDEGWFKTIVMAGGTASIPGMPERLEKELLKCLDSSLSVGLNVVKPVIGDAAWYGANMLCNLSTFQEEWCVTKKQFARFGHRVAHAIANEIL